MRKLIAVAGIIACAGAAQAADLGAYEREDRYAGSPFNWTGLYVGLHAGYGTGSWDGTLTYDPGTGPVQGVFDPANRSIDADGWLGGGQIGFNLQTGRVLWGVEVDGSWTGIEGGDDFNTVAGPPPAGVNWAIDTKLDALGTVRGRLGFLASDNLLIYGTGGLAVGRTSADLAVHQLFPANNNLTATGSASENHVGWTAGGGFEWALGRSFSVKAEYLYVDLGSADYRLVGTNFITNPDSKHTTDSFPADLTIHTVRVGVNYKFDN